MNGCLSQVQLVALISGDNVMAIGCNSSAHDDYLIMPATEVIAGTTDMVSFSLKSRCLYLLRTI